MMRARVIRGSTDGERWAGPALDSSVRTASPIGGQFRSAGEPLVDATITVDPDYEDGFAKGFAQGMQLAQTQTSENLKVLAQLTAYVREPMAMLDEQVDDELVRLVLAIARQVVRREVRTDPQQIVAVVREACGALDDVRGNLRIALHPDEARLVRAMFTAEESLAAIVVEEDPSITRGGCTVKSEISFVDAQVEARIARIAVDLLGDERTSPASEG
ncbi:MAG: flagellar assembly protein FliH [Gammaproteobacteria bacterium]|jgi:flagellar assembly protein FliH